MVNGWQQFLSCSASLLLFLLFLKVFLKLDFSNAFNTIDRSCFLQEVRARMPGLAAWADFCYSRPSKLILGTRTISSESGVQQGDPLGQLLCPLALQSILQELASTRFPGGLGLVFSYLDDLCLAGEAQAVKDALVTLQARCATAGFSLSTGPTNEDGNVSARTNVN